MVVCDKRVVSFFCMGGLLNLPRVLLLERSNGVIVAREKFRNLLLLLVLLRFNGSEHIRAVSVSDCHLLKLPREIVDL